jgi:hypothetical protein
MQTYVGGWTYESQKHADVILEWSLIAHAFQLYHSQITVITFGSK